MNEYLSHYSALFKTFLKQNPEYFYLIAAAISLLFFIGSIRKWDWIIDKSGNYYERETGFWVNIFGEKLVRLYVTVVAAAVTLLSLMLFFYAKLT